MIRTALGILLASLAHSVPAGGPLVQVADRQFTEGEIRALMQAEKLDLPSQAVEKLRREAALKAWALRMGVREDKAAQELYRKAFGNDLDMDKARADAFDLGTVRRKAAARMHLMEAWVAGEAEDVPLLHLDPEAYWNLFKESRSYRVRLESGSPPKFEDLEYTVAELAVVPERKLAHKGGAVYLDGREFNAYVKAHYDEIRLMARRRETLDEVRGKLIRKAVGEKAAAAAGPVLPVPSALDLERRVVDYAKRNMMKEDLALAGKEFDTPAQYRDFIHGRYMETRKALIAKVRRSIETGGTIATGNEAADLFVRGSMVRARREALAAAITEVETLDWMKARKFPGNRREAHFVLANQAMERFQEEAVKKAGITLGGL